MINPLIYTSDYIGGGSNHDKLVENSDWSARHVRLKYQMVLSSLFLYLFVSTEVTEINLFGMMKFSGEIPVDKLFLTLLLFWIFSTISFLTRTFFESSRWSSLRKDLCNNVKNIQVNELAAKEQFRNFNLSTPSSELQSFLSNPNEDRVLDVRKAITTVHESMRCGSGRELSNILDEISTDLNQLETSLKVLRSGYHPNITEYHIHCSACRSNISTISNIADNLSKDLESDKHDESRKVKDVTRRLEGYFRCLETLTTALPKLEPISKKLYKNEKIRNVIYNLQNYGLAVVLPALASLTFVYFAVASKYGFIQ